MSQKKKEKKKRNVRKETETTNWRAKRELRRKCDEGRVRVRVPRAKVCRDK